MSGVEKLFTGMRVSATGLSAERLRIDVIAENIANARTTRTPEGGPYRRKMVLFQPLLENALGGGLGGALPRGVEARDVVPDMDTPFEKVLDPSHADAHSRRGVVRVDDDDADFDDLGTRIVGETGAPSANTRTMNHP